MKHYLFTDYITNEEFIVGANNLAEAKAIANDYFDEPHFITKISDFEAEMSGLDEY